MSERGPRRRWSNLRSEVSRIDDFVRCLVRAPYAKPCRDAQHRYRPALWRAGGSDHKAAAYLHFDDVDITIKVVAPPRAGAAVLETVWDVTARESGPGLGTWWGSWRRFLPAGQGQPERRVAEEIRDAVDRIRQMLDAHAQRVSHRGGGRA